MKKILLAIIALFMIFGLTGCTKSDESDATETSEDGKTVLTIVLPNISITSFEEAFEEAYPEYDLQTESIATGTVNGEITRRLRKGHGSDLVVTNLPRSEVQDYAYDITTQSFVENYQSQTIKSLTIDGVVKYLPLPCSAYGYVINKTLLDELGLEVPETTDDLLNILKVSKEKGLGTNANGYNLGIGTIGSTYLGAYYVSNYAPDYLSTVDGVKWLASFEAGEATFTGNWENSVDFIKTCVDEGYINPDKFLLNFNSTTSTAATAFKPEVELPERTAIMCFTSLDMYKSICSLSDDEFVMVPCLPNSEEGNAMISAVSNDFLFINKAISEDENKLNAALAFCEFLSSEEGQRLWMKDTNCPYSYLEGVEPDYDSMPNDIASYFNNGQVFVNPFPTNLLSVIGTQLTPVVTKGADMAEALKNIDDYVINGSDEVEYDLSIVGTVAEDMLCENGNVRKEETKLGNLISDAIKEMTGADVALVNGGGIRSSLYEGDVSGSDLDAVCPYGNLIIVVKMDGATLREAITNGIQKTYKPAGQFLQVSGIKYSYTPAEDENDTAILVSLTHEDGTEIKDDETFTVAYTNYMGGSGTYVDAGDGYTMLNVYDKDTPVKVELIEETNKTYCDALKEYFANHNEEPVSVAIEGRIEIISED